MELKFRERTPTTPQPAGDVGGDYQSTDAYERSWFAELSSGKFALVTVVFFGYDDTAEVAEGEGRFLQRQTEFMVCDDITDPGSDWGNSDYRYERVDVGTLVPTEEHAYVACAALRTEDIRWPIRVCGLAGRMSVDLSNTDHCPKPSECGECGGTDRLAVATWETDLGVYCAPVCGPCLDAGHTRRRPLGAVMRAVLDHCEHLGIDFDEMATALDNEGA
jgi:hypothetical protein